MSANIPQQQHPNAQLLLSATKGFDYLFSNDIVTAREHFKKHDDPFHMMGLGVCAFLEAALGMESGLMAEATRCLAISEAGARQQTRGAKSDMAYRGRFTHGLEWEILNADAVVLLGLTHALSESYMGYLQCMYSLNSAHSKFTKLYKTVFPQGLPPTPGAGAGATLTVPTSTSRPQGLRHKQSDISLASASSVSSLASAATIASPAAVAPAAKVNGFFTRWVGTASTPALPAEDLAPDGPVEDLIVAGTAFGFGLFNLVFSLLPKKVQGLVGFLGFKHDRKLALQALALAATKTDVHGTFAGLVLMTYHGGVLLLSGYQANEEKILIEYQIIVDQIASRYPTGALWILNRAKIMRMSYKADIAIDILNEGLHNNKGHSFAQADMLLVFELAWTLLSQMRYQEAADAFMRITELNSWSHGTYYFITAGCYFSLGDMEKAQSLLDAIPNLIDKKKISGKDLPTEVFIKKKLIFYKEKHLRRTGSEDNFIQSIKISPAEGANIKLESFGTITRASPPAIAQTHIDILTTLTPPVSISTANIASSLSRIPPSPRTPKSPAVPMLPTDDLDTPDEHAVRALLLGIHYRTIKAFAPARGFLEEAVGSGSAVRVSTWVAGVAAFELAVLDLKEAAEGDRVRAAEVSDVSATPRPQQNGFGSGAQDPAARRRIWADAMASASARLDTALGLATSSVDLSSRLDSRIAMLRDEIATKGEMLKLSTP